MSKEFELDLRHLERAIRNSPEAAGKGAKQALDDIKDDWVREARDIAPIAPDRPKRAGGNLRKQINGELEGQALESSVIVTANATQKSKKTGKTFNYAYYIHEGHMAADGKSLQHPGTVEKFLDESAEKRQAEWQRMIEEDIRDALRREGW